jgi:tetratricopeptide (TPR) repeat protein
VLYSDGARYPEAIAAARTAIELGPEADRAYLAHYVLGLSYRSTGALEEAASEFGKAYQLHPELQQAKDGYEDAVSKLRQRERTGSGR